MVSLHIPGTQIRFSSQQAEYIYNKVKNSVDGLLYSASRILASESGAWSRAIVAGAKVTGSSVAIEGKPAMATFNAALAAKGALTGAVLLTTVDVGNLVYDSLTEHPTLETLRNALKEVEWLQDKVNNDIKKPLERMVWKTRS